MLRSSDGTILVVGFLGLKVRYYAIVAVFLRTTETEKAQGEVVLSLMFYLRKIAEIGIGILSTRNLNIALAPIASSRVVNG